MSSPPSLTALTVSVVIPVYQGEKSLPGLMQEIAAVTQQCITPQGVAFSIKEVLLVHDSGPDRSDLVLEALAIQYPFV